MAPKKSDHSSVIIKGFRFAAVAAGIKETGKPDLAVILSDRPANAAAMFTTNRLQAAPVLQGKRAMRGGRIQAVLINSGNANAATGPEGLKVSLQSAVAAAKTFGAASGQVLVSSTGKIGIPLPLKKITSALPALKAKLGEKNFAETARAIMTTDAFPKMHAVRGTIGGKPFTVAGFAKGAGMIEPHMATMLAYVMTDLDVPTPLLKRVFRKAVEQSFNVVSVDGDTSTNDTALVLANGSSGIKIQANTPTYHQFVQALEEVCQALAYMMVQDGEGATKVVKIEVHGAKNEASAKRIAYTIARSQLVKTSFFGEDPNWGRVFAAVGYSGETFDPSRVDIYYGKTPLVQKGRPTGKREEIAAHKLMKNSHFTVHVALGRGPGRAQVWTSDLTYDYVKINAEYRT